MASFTDKSPLLNPSSNLEVGESSTSKASKIDIVSSCDPDRLRSLFSSFNSEKASLLCSTGFGGLLTLPSLGKLNTHFALWLLNRFNDQTCHLHLDNGVRIPLTDIDVSLIFYIPCQGRLVDFTRIPNKATVDAFVEKILGKDSKSSLTMSYLEQIVRSDIGAHSSKAEKDAFKIACVLCSIHYLLAPENDLEFPYALLRNFSPNVKTNRMNWCAYVLWTLRRASIHARLQINEGSNKFALFGCVLLLQVFYLDNLNFGPLTPYHTVFPRVAAYNQTLMESLIQEDFTGTSILMFEEFGRREVRECLEVCYTRGWNEDASDSQEAHSTLDYVSLIENLSQILKVTEQFAEQVNSIKGSNNPCDMTSFQSARDSYQQVRYILKDTIHQLSMRSAELLKKRHINLFRHVIAPQNDVLQKRVSEVLEDVSGIKRVKFGDASSSTSVVPGLLQRCITTTLRSPQTSAIKPQQHFLQKKRVWSHSEFPLSCFQLGLFHPKVPRGWKVKAYRWMMSETMQNHELNRAWVLFSSPRNITLTGNDVVFNLRQNGDFTVPFVDSIMLIWCHLDAKVYKRFQPQLGVQRRWRHFLPASFAEEVIGNPEYLNTNVVKSSFLGSHITYDIEHCQQIVAPVRVSGTWSCYFWDFRQRSVTVLDPVMMGSDCDRTKDKHSKTLFKLHKAIMDCKDHFFSGWDTPEVEWTTFYMNDTASRCRLPNTGLHAVHYARSFCGKNILLNLKEPTEPNLSEARGELLFHIFTCPHNIGYRPYFMMPAIQESLN